MFEWLVVRHEECPQSFHGFNAVFMIFILRKLWQDPLDSLNLGMLLVKHRAGQVPVDQFEDGPSRMIVLVRSSDVVWHDHEGDWNAASIGKGAFF